MAEKGDNAPMSSVRLRPNHAPRCIVIAGPNGAGKTTFAREFLPREGRVVHFVNADLIASGLSPLRPELAARRGGRLVLTELRRLARARQDFAFESTLSGRTDLPLLRQWKADGYRIELVFLSRSRWSWHSSVSRRVCAREGMMSRASMWCADSTEVGGTFS